ncbi:MAG: Ig-like domain-containing protein [Acidobacteriia bacterium]|nr:Ig-like domain-containing protein [Terriglobia bacterium]
MRQTAILMMLTLGLAGCSQQPAKNAGPQAKAFGTAIVVSSGDKQVAASGMALDQAVVVQVNDAQGSAVAGAAVTLAGPSGASFQPASGLTDASGQFTAAISLGSSGRYQLTASTPDKSGKAVSVNITAVSLGYEQTLGRQLSTQYCTRCHDPESTPERVSNFDNLDPKPHAFTEGETLNKLADTDLTAIIGHGGPALSKSPSMPPYGYTLSSAEIRALVAYIRAVQDPPYRTPGVVYAQK